ncbi:MAG: hypothetical protein JRI68_27160 [Deltaproteobacteria bacterium]|nr:hypothetical protein [Deltaproteobacteria bacterium]
MARHTVVLGALILSSLWACGGKTTVDEGGTGGSTTTSSSTSTSSSGTSSSGSSSSSSGAVGCDDSSDCPQDWVCIFDTGVCAPSCGDPCDPCDDGEVCDVCATGSCLGCKDCVPACVAATDGQCDDQGDCGDQEVCVYSVNECFPICSSADCADPNLVCVECATSSCPCCLDCGSACMPL